jgi:hypothetical protein
MIMQAKSAPIALSPHPTTPSSAVSAVDVVLSRDAVGALILRYRLHGNVSRLRLPPAAPAERVDGLWQRTCCEAFIAAAEVPAYREFNFSPSGQWAAYAFAAERRRDVAADPGRDAQPTIALQRGDDRLELIATLPAHVLPAAPRWQVGLAVVAEDSAGNLSYWALRHPAQRPDFHHRGAFAFALDSGIQA